jgi:galactokinase
LVEQAGNLLKEHFDAEPVWAGMAPGRVNLIGEHTDYNQGWVLPIAIDRYTVLAAAPGGVSDTLRLFSASLGEQAVLPLKDDAGRHPLGWMRYLEGVVAEYRNLGVICPAMDIVVVSSVPLGGGLSSSAALEVAAAHLIEAAAGQRVTSEMRIAASVRAERHFAGVPCGIMDQTIVEMAQGEHALLLDCQDVSFSYVPCLGRRIVMLVIHSGVSHSLASGAYAERRAECESAAEKMNLNCLRFAQADQLKALDAHPVLMRRARHVMTENRRVHAMAAALAAEDDHRVGVLLSESHESLRDDFAVSCEPVDRLVQLAQAEEGVLGARMTGGGFGGCVIAFVRSEAVDNVAQSICRRYSQYTGTPTRCFIVEAVSGAQQMNARHD